MKGKKHGTTKHSRPKYSIKKVTNTGRKYFPGPMIVANHGLK